MQGRFIISKHVQKNCLFQRVPPSVRGVASVVRSWCSWITAQWLGLRGLHQREEATDLFNQHHDVVNIRGHLPSNNNVAIKVENILLHISKYHISQCEQWNETSVFRDHSLEEFPVLLLGIRLL